MSGGLDRRSVIGLSAAGLLGAALSAGAARSGAEPSADRLMFIRHGEDASGHGAPFGVDVNGELDARSLVVRGWSRAGALVSLFDPRDHLGNRLATRPDITRPTTIFAHDPGSTDSKRSFETVSPLAAALELQVNSQFGSTQVAEVAAALSVVRGPTLVAWKHESIAAIIGHLGEVHPAPPTSWPERRFDMVYVLTREGSRWRFSQLPQMLLAGDQATPIV